VLLQVKSKEMSLSLACGKVDLNLYLGDIFDLKVDALFCPVEVNSQRGSGLFGVIKKRISLPPQILSHHQKFQLGKSKLVSRVSEKSAEGSSPITQGSQFRHLVLMPILSPYLTLDRYVIERALSSAFDISESMGFETVSMPLLGSSEAHCNYEIMCWLVIKAVEKFGNTNPQKLRKVTLTVYNSQAFEACKDQFFHFGRASAA